MSSIVNAAYRQYINSPAWREKRRRRLRHDGWQCARCDAKDRLEVHHLTYDRLGNERIADLVTLCHECHARDHGRDPDLPSELSLQAAFSRRMEIERRQEAINDIRDVVQRIALMSHAPTQSYDVVLPGDDVPNTPSRWRVNDSRDPVPHLGGHVPRGGDTAAPRGGVPRFDDTQIAFRQKSHIYFERKLNRLVERGTGLKGLDALLKEAKQALEDWRKTPPYNGEEPLSRGTFRWKCAIADYGGKSLSDRDVAEIIRLYASGRPISRATIYRYRARYRGLRVLP